MKENTKKYKEKIEEIINKNNGIVTASDFKSKGIPSIYLTKLVQKGILKRYERGIYLTNNADFDEYHFFQIKYKVCIFSFFSALYLHNMTDRVPDTMEATVYKGYNASNINKSVIIHYSNKNIYDIGIIQKNTIFGNPVNVYNMEHTICDLFKNRKKIDPEIFTKAVNNYMKSPEKDINKLYEYSKIFKIEDKIREIIEVLYE